MNFKVLIGLVSAIAGSKAFDLQSAEGASEFESLDIPGRYIVEFEDASTSAFATQLSAGGFDFDIQYDYSTSSIFNGASVQISNDNDTTFYDLQTLRSVKNVYPAQVIKLDDTVETATSRPWNPHLLTGVDALHKQGITGEGVVIAVVDTGVDYNHEVFGSGVGDSFSIKAAFDLTDESGDGMDCNGHGTFVSSVIVGNTKDAIGVAPDAQVVMYKVFPECSGDTSTDLVMAGIQKAYDDGHKIISISIGSDSGFSSAPMSLMASRIAQERTVLIAAGNSGEYGPLYASTPSAGKGVISVGAVQQTHLTTFPITITSSSGEEKIYPYYSYTGEQIEFSAELEVEYTEMRGCNFVSNGQDNSNKAIFARRGIGCYENIEYHNIAAGGYGAAFLYNSYGRSWYHPDITPLTDNRNAYAVVEEEVGTWLAEQVAAGNTLTVKISQSDPMLPLENTDFLGAGKMDYYSSQGPTYELDFFPTISAPGGNSWGAYPGGEYRVGSGTSYACPYAAGVAALFEFAVGIEDSQDFLKKLVSTANDLDLYDWSADVLDTSFKAPLNQQGAGIINAVGLIEAQTTVVSAPFLELNDTVHRVSQHTIQIRNGNPEPITYQVVHEVGTSLYIKSNANIIQGLVNEEFAPYTLDEVATVTLSTEELTLEPGEVGEVTVEFSTEGVSEETATLLQGKIVFYGDVGNSVAVPYMGLEADLYEWTILAEQPLAIRYYRDDGSLGFMEDDPDYEFDVYNLDGPRFYYNIRYGTREISIDLVEPDYSIETDWEWPLVPDHNKWVNSIGYEEGVVLPFQPRRFQQRVNGLGYNTFTRFTNYSVVPGGEYKALFRALRPWGDYYNKEDWQLFTSSVFKVKAPPVDETSSEEETSTEESSEQETSTEESSEQETSTEESSEQETSTEESSEDETSTAESTEPTEEPSEEETFTEESTVETTEDPTSTIDDDETSTESSTEEPTAAPTGPYSRLTLGEAITNINVTSERTSDAFGYTSDWLVVSFTFNTTDRDIILPPNAVVQVAIPDELQFIAHPEYAQYLEPSLQIFYTKSDNLIMQTGFDYDTNVIDFKFYNSNKVITRLEGVVFFTMKLEQDFISSLSPGEYEFAFHTSVETYTPTFRFIPLIRSEPIKLITGKADEVEWLIDIPGAYSELTSVDISSDIDTSADWEQYFYDCAKFRYTIGKEFDQWGNFTAGSDGNQYSNTTDGYISITDSTGSPVAEAQCSLESISLSFIEPLAEDEVLRIVLHSSAFTSGTLYMANVVNVDITAGGSTKRELFSYVLDETYYASTRIDRLAFDAYELADEQSSSEVTEEPTSEEPTEEPTGAPTSEEPTEEPTEALSSEEPTEEPTSESTSEVPTEEPTSEEPSSEEPTEEPTSEDPTVEPTGEPTTDDSSIEPTAEPTEEPSEEPTSESVSESTSEEPTSNDSSIVPTAGPTSDDSSIAPTVGPTGGNSTIAPTAGPTSGSSSGQSVITRATTATQTTITSVCNVCAETPVTITYTAPVITNPVSYTTVTSVCHVCAETPITVTLTLPCETEEIKTTQGPKTVTYTEVCHSCAEKPITYTYTAPEYTHGAERTTVTSVCNVCAETPVTVTYTAPKASQTVPAQYSSAKEFTTSEGIQVPTVTVKQSGAHSESVTHATGVASSAHPAQSDSTVTSHLTETVHIVTPVRSESVSTNIPAPTINSIGNENSGARFTFAGVFSLLPVFLLAI